MSKMSILYRIFHDLLIIWVAVSTFNPDLHTGLPDLMANEFMSLSTVVMAQNYIKKNNFGECSLLVFTTLTYMLTGRS